MLINGYEKPAVTRLQSYDACFNYFVYLFRTIRKIGLSGSCPLHHIVDTVMVQLPYHGTDTKQALVFYHFL